jgi:HEAT repeat protein
MHLLTTLIKLGDESVHPLLTAAAMDDNEGMRLRAVMQIGDLKLASQRELILYKSERDPNARVRKEAKKALEKLDGKTDIQETPEDETAAP